MFANPSLSNRQMDLTAEQIKYPRPYDDDICMMHPLVIISVSPISTQILVCSTY